MATEYIKVSDITDRHLIKHSPQVLQEYVDRVNDWYEFYAESKNVVKENIRVPVPNSVKELLKAKLNIIFAADRIMKEDGSTNEYYAGLYSLSKEIYNDLVVRVNRAVIRGYINETTTRVVFGRRTR